MFSFDLTANDWILPLECVQHVQEQVEAANLTRDETSTHESGDPS